MKTSFQIVCCGIFIFSSCKIKSETTVLLTHYFPHSPWHNWGIYYTAGQVFYFLLTEVCVLCYQPLSPVSTMQSS